MKACTWRDDDETNGGRALLVPQTCEGMAFVSLYSWEGDASAESFLSIEEARALRDWLTAAIQEAEG